MLETGYLVRIDLSFVIISVMTALWLEEIIAVNYRGG